MNIKVQNRQREIFMVHGVSDEASRTSSQKGLIKQTGYCLAVLPCVGTSDYQFTENRNRHDTTWNPSGFEHQ